MIEINEKDSRVVALRKEEALFADLFKNRCENKKALDNAVSEYQAVVARGRDRGSIEDEADRLLAGEEIASAVVTRDDIEKLEHQLAVIDAAIQKQERAVHAARGQFSLAVCEAAKNQYVEIERRLARAVQKLAEANEDEAKFFQELRDAGVSNIIFQPMRIQHVGFASDSQSRAAMHKREVEEFCPEAAI